MSNQIPFIALSLLFSCIFLVFHIWIKIKFIAEGMQLSGSFHKKYITYKNEWTVFQRIFLIPLFSNRSTTQYKALGILNYTQLCTSIVMFVFLLLRERHLTMVPWEYGGILIVIILILQLIVACL